jgi:hypothetical protein
MNSIVMIYNEKNSNQESKGAEAKLAFGSATEKKSSYYGKFLAMLPWPKCLPGEPVRPG